MLIRSLCRASLRQMLIGSPKWAKVVKESGAKPD